MNQFAHPQFLWLLFLPIIFRMLLPTVKGLQGDALRIPFLDDINRVAIKSGDVWQMQVGKGSKISASAIVLFLIWFFLVFAAARPQLVGEPIRIKAQGRDILMVMDISTSMLEPDFVYNGKRINRLNAVKLTAQDFIEKRVNDRIGLILFGTNAYLQAPLTFDKKSVSEILWAMDAGMAGQSTAIGDALGLSLKTLKDAEDPDKKIVILLTDGENNDGRLSLYQAISLAKTEGVKIYTIGVGSENEFVASILGVRFSAGGSGLDEDSLKEIADETKGRYFRAKDTRSLIKIYEEIDKLEPSNQDEQFIQETKDWFYIPLLFAFFLAIGWILLTRGVKR